MYDDLLNRGEVLRALATDGVPMLAICGTYQLFGHGFTTVDGEEPAGIDILTRLLQKGAALE